MAQPLALILARNLVGTVSLPALLLDEDGTLVFFNEAAGGLLGRRFEEVGPLDREEWATRFGPFDEHGRPAATDSLPLALTVKEGRPAQGRFHVRSASDEAIDIEASALPLVAEDGFHGALVVFWAADQAADGSG